MQPETSGQQIKMSYFKTSARTYTYDLSYFKD